MGSAAANSSKSRSTRSSVSAFRRLAALAPSSPAAFCSQSILDFSVVVVGLVERNFFPLHDLRGRPRPRFVGSLAVGEEGQVGHGIPIVGDVLMGGNLPVVRSMLAGLTKKRTFVMGA